MQLYGKSWTRREIEARVGRLEQIGGIRCLQMAEGAEYGVTQYQVRTGTGLAYTVAPERGLDITRADFGGVPLSWQSPNGDVHPAYYDDQDQAWLRTATGGLLMTCGLTQVGAPNVDEGESLGLHGRYHHTPARQVGAFGAWQDDEYVMQIRGSVEETIVYGTFLRLTRTITSRLGSNTIQIEDTVENLGFQPSPLMILYHFNFGFPLLAENTQITFPSARQVPNEPEMPLGDYEQWQAPDPNHAAQVIFHEELHTDADGQAEARIYNPTFPTVSGASPLTLRLGWRTATLPKLTQWRMPGAGTHVLGIEPGNCHVRGRAAARADGSLEMLAPGASRRFSLYVDLSLA